MNRKIRDELDDVAFFDSQNFDEQQTVQLIDTPGFPSLTSMACLTTLIPPDIVLLVTDGRRQQDLQSYYEFEQICCFFKIPVHNLKTHSCGDSGVELTSGAGLDRVNRLLTNLQPHCSPSILTTSSSPMMVIEQVYFGDQVGLIVSGLISGVGSFNCGDSIKILPDHQPGRLNSIHRLRMSVEEGYPGQYVTFSLALPSSHSLLERGMVIVKEGCGDGINVHFATAVILSSDIMLSLRRDQVDCMLPHQGTYLVNGSKCAATLTSICTLQLSMPMPVYPQSPCIFISAHLLLCSYVARQ
jgi:hypothetical protein